MVLFIRNNHPVRAMKYLQVQIYSKNIFKVAMFIGSIWLSGGVVSAQTVLKTDHINSCWFGSLSFSKGATARAGNGVMKCSEGGFWVDTSEKSSICFRGGKAFSIGAVEGVSNNKKLKITCLENGTWSLSHTD